MYLTIFFAGVTGAVDVFCVGGPGLLGIVGVNGFDWL